eukprot:766697-Hanusia_phi.AAC.9
MAGLKRKMSDRRISGETGGRDREREGWREEEEEEEDGFVERSSGGSRKKSLDAEDGEQEPELEHQECMRRVARQWHVRVSLPPPLLHQHLSSTTSSLTTLLPLVIPSLPSLPRCLRFSLSLLPLTSPAALLPLSSPSLFSCCSSPSLFSCCSSTSLFSCCSSPSLFSLSLLPLSSPAALLPLSSPSLFSCCSSTSPPLPPLIASRSLSGQNMSADDKAKWCLDPPPSKLAKVRRRCREGKVDVLTCV